MPILFLPCSPSVLGIDASRPTEHAQYARLLQAEPGHDRAGRSARADRIHRVLLLDVRSPTAEVELGARPEFPALVQVVTKNWRKGRFFLLRRLENREVKIAARSHHRLCPHRAHSRDFLFCADCDLNLRPWSANNILVAGRNARSLEALRAGPGPQLLLNRRRGNKPLSNILADFGRSPPMFELDLNIFRISNSPENLRRCGRA